MTKCTECDCAMFDKKAEMSKLETKKKLTTITSSVIYQSMLAGGGQSSVNNFCEAGMLKPIYIEWGGVP